MIKATDYTYEYVQPVVVDRILDDVLKTGDTVVDFKGTKIQKYAHEKIAQMMVYAGVEVLNIENDNDRNIIEFMKYKLEEPKADNIKDYVEILKKRFKVGEACILNEKVYMSKGNCSYKRYLVLIEEYKDTRVVIRKYFSSMVQPAIFERAGGKYASCLSYITELSYVDLFQGEVRLEHPRNNLERQIIDILFNS